MPASLARCAATSTEQTIEFEKLDAEIILDMDGAPSLFQNSLREMLDGNSTISCEVLEHCLLESGKQYGVYGVKKFAFKPPQQPAPNC